MTQKKNTFDDWQKIQLEEQQQQIDKKNVTNIWNIDVFMQFCGEANLELNWANVMKKLDRPHLFIRDEKALTNLFKYLQRARKIQNF